MGMSEKEWEAKKRIKILVDELPESVLDAALEALYDLKYGKQPVQSEVDLPPERAKEPGLLSVLPKTTTGHTCPVCNGAQTVPEGFYTQNMEGIWSGSGAGDRETCRSCSGTGVVWG